ncbi:helix-turn-helix transcriptional regulator [Myroides odoratimimus]|uniref:helix-turn-helix transcriptional regulator n=1 Tax=Myroides odoratimimus TaxID=76832 RepID=UPI002578C4F5|nr:helix-turn-helix domain-containing protein [Myroides odoratimimus]MDM1328104.1 helix-turn-helix domain-containing protein [Myroides odoratimimus]
MSKVKNNELLTRKEVLDFFGISSSTLWRWCKNGYIKQYGLGGRSYYKREELNNSLVLLNNNSCS